MEVNLKIDEQQTATTNFFDILLDGHKSHDNPEHRKKKTKECLRVTSSTKNLDSYLNKDESRSTMYNLFD